MLLHPESINDARTAPRPPAGHLIRRALLFIRENYKNGIGVADVARHLGISTSLLRLRFHTMHGKSVRDVILETRLAAAQRMLKSTDETIAYVAGACGFASTCRMSHFFRERLGMPPTEWRRQRRRK